MLTLQNNSIFDNYMSPELCSNLLNEKDIKYLDLLKNNIFSLGIILI